jgi:hypothetical protein
MITSVYSLYVPSISPAWDAESPPVLYGPVAVEPGRIVGLLPDPYSHIFFTACAIEVGEMITHSNPLTLVGGVASATWEETFEVRERVRMLGEPRLGALCEMPADFFPMLPKGQRLRVRARNVDSANHPLSLSFIVEHGPKRTEAPR